MEDAPWLFLHAQKTETETLDTEAVKTLLHDATRPITYAISQQREKEQIAKM